MTKPLPPPCDPTLFPRNATFREPDASRTYLMQRLLQFGHQIKIRSSHATAKMFSFNSVRFDVINWICVLIALKCLTVCAMSLSHDKISTRHQHENELLTKTKDMSKPSSDLYRVSLPFVDTLVSRRGANMIRSLQSHHHERGEYTQL